VSLIYRSSKDSISLLSDQLLKKGVIVLKNFFNKDDISELRKAADQALIKFKKNNGIVHKNSIFINNAFTYDEKFLEIVSNEYICQIIEESIGERITLSNSSLANVTFIDGISTGGINGGSWHTDSRYVQKGRVRLNHGFSYLVILCIDNFKGLKSSTKYVNGSHLDLEKPERIIDESKYDIKTIDGIAGDVFILDSGIWHKAGEPTNESRWGLVSYYSPWYFKPYYQFSEMFSYEQIQKFTDRQINLMHMTSKPPINQFHRMNTFISPSEFKKGLVKPK